MKIKLRDIERSLAPHGLIVVEKRKYDSLNSNFHLHEYASYEEYRRIQIFHNKRKINNIWADEHTLDLVTQRIKKEFPRDGVQNTPQPLALTVVVVDNRRFDS